MNAKRIYSLIFILVLAGLAGQVCAESASKVVANGNKLYLEENYSGAGSEYDRAAELKPHSFEPKFNKANSLYRLGEMDKAIDLYKEVAARSTDKNLIARSKYNLGNSHFRKGMKAQAQAGQQAVQGAPPQETEETSDPAEDYKSAIKSWRQVLDIDKSNEKVKKNIEIAKRTLQKLKEQQKQQQQDGESSEDGEKKKQENDDKNKQEGDKQQDQDKQNKEQNQQNEDEQKQDEQDSQQQDQQQAKQEDAPDATAEEILKKEKEDKKARQIMRLRQMPVEKDW